MTETPLAALPIAICFVLACVLVAGGPLLRRAWRDGLAVSCAGAVLVICVLLARDAARAPFAYWLGGWRPRGGVAIGISLSIDPLGAALCAFAAVLVLAALVYSLRYFDAVAGLYHALMLLFGAAMVGFCLTGDVFSLIVFFELMSAVAYALTAYRIEERAPIQGAINFAITNSIGGYTMFIGVALLYARTGALNMAQIGAALGGRHPDALVIVAFVLLVLGFLTKAAVVPLHFWLADAHAVAPVPVCVLFSGVMVELGIYAVARVYWVMFAGPFAPELPSLRVILIALGTVTAVLGAGMCFAQRHIKRLLAFSTISHTGLFLCGVGLLDHKALSGVALYVVGHGLTKAALFMCCGVLLHRFATVDEYDLHGRGREIPLLGVLFVAGALLLAALPPFTSFSGKSAIEGAASSLGFGWLTALFTGVSAVTAGAVLRISGRIFLGWGPARGPDPGMERAAEERVDETRDERDHTPWQMLAVPLVLLLGAAAVGLVPGVEDWVGRAAAQFTEHRAYAGWVLHAGHVSLPAVPAEHHSVLEWASGFAAVLAALMLAGVGLLGRDWAEAVPGRLRGGTRTAVWAIRGLHTGVINDYIACWTAGAGLLAVVCLLALR